MHAWRLAGRPSVSEHDVRARRTVITHGCAIAATISARVCLGRSSSRSHVLRAMARAITLVGHGRPARYPRATHRRAARQAIARFVAAVCDRVVA